jgi:cytochrome c-type biogenesis protein CcmF
MWQSLPEFGTGVLYAILVSAAYTFAVSVAAGRGRPRLLQSARLAAYGTTALVGFAVLLLAYAFITHDFRISYVARYSDRSMTTAYLFTSLWGGQDGSLLWWLMLLSLYTAACVRWLKGRYRLLQPYVIATLMVIVSFFAILMIFSANPFAQSVAGARADGEGLNPLLQNFYMIIHPPSLYTGFVGCSVPFAFAIAALVSGRLDNEWINAVRKWMMFAWLFLSIGNVLGMIWAYEELGWGGSWAWDPVENAACLPWFAATAYVHSTMIQERTNGLKIWNVFLICLTFLLTIFGTFLTRSGLISSVHSFAQSNIGIFFVWFMGFTVAVCAGLIVWRLPLLRGRSNMESVASREAAFVANNWVLLGLLTFIAVATIFPKISEWLWKESVTVGPPFFNRWAAPFGVTLLLLMGLAPLFGWRKTSKEAFKRALLVPLIALVGTAALHLAVGSRLGYPAFVAGDAFYPGFIGVVLQKIGSSVPLLIVSLAAFNVAVIGQEFARGIAARRRSSGKGGDQESIGLALFRLVEKSRRRYGGYVVHVGIVLMFLGYCGNAWKIERETSLVPGEKYQIGQYELTYQGSRREVDQTKMMIFSDIMVTRNGEPVGSVHPAKFIYKRMPQSPTSEVSMLHSFREDLYAVVGTVDPTTKRATFQLHVNPLVSWIWAGLGVLMIGAVVSLWPELSFRELGAWGYARAAVGAATGTMAAILIAMGPSAAYATPRSIPDTPRAQSPPEASIRPIVPQGYYFAAIPLFGLVAGVAFARRRRAREAAGTRD